MSTIVLKTAKRETIVPRSKIRIAVAEVFGKKESSSSKKQSIVIVKPVAKKAVVKK